MVKTVAIGYTAAGTPKTPQGYYSCDPENWLLQPKGGYDITQNYQPFKIEYKKLDDGIYYVKAEEFNLFVRYKLCGILIFNSENSYRYQAIDINKTFIGRLYNGVVTVEGQQISSDFKIGLNLVINHVMKEEGEMSFYKDAVFSSV